MCRFADTGKNIVAVVGGDETLHGKPHLLGKQSGGNIAEIAARHANNHILRFSDTFQLRVRIEVIEGLGRKRATLMELAEVRERCRLSSSSMKAAFTNA